MSLLKIGTRVRHDGHGRGTIIGYNTDKSLFYPGSRYPYIVRFDSGFQEVYSRGDLATKQAVTALRTN